MHVSKSFSFSLPMFMESLSPFGHTIIDACMKSTKTTYLPIQLHYKHDEEDQGEDPGQQDPLG